MAAEVVATEASADDVGREAAAAEVVVVEADEADARERETVGSVAVQVVDGAVAFGSGFSSSLSLPYPFACHHSSRFSMYHRWASCFLRLSSKIFLSWFSLTRLWIKRMSAERPLVLT